MPMIDKLVKFAAISALSAGLALPALAQTKEDKVVAVVNGYEIKTSEVEIAAQDILGQLPEIPAKLRYPFIVEYLVERHLLAQAAVKETTDRMAAEAAARQHELSDTLARQTAEAEQQIAAAKQRALSEMHGIATEVARSVTEKVMGSAADPGNLATAVDRALAERVS